MPTRIIFGTDGWRGVMADDYTFENVRRCAHGMAQYLLATKQAARGLVVGYDTRFESDLFAQAVAEVLAAHEIKVYLVDRATPTPVISYAILSQKAAGAVNITASPSAALKKITGGTVQVSDDDMTKSFQANYGERMRCRAIVLSNMRRAQEVWAKARQNTSMDFFGDLAEQYSVEPQSKALRGEVPPIRRNGGQPQLEDAAFELQKDELSGIVQLGDKFIILKCDGRTETVDVNMKDVHDILYQDIFEKKLRIAMNEKFSEIHDKARIDNYLAGTSQAPDRVKGDAAKSAPRVDSAVRPTAGAVPQPR